ncbi:MAG TPA: hypothetical protein VNX00_06260 [Herbaspirillum sp.]|jgi:hypothetical protein|nr:hypothetical protein [Herbaspirillum sp.]
MDKISGKQACQLAAHLIEEQLEVLSISITLIVQRAQTDDLDASPIAKPIQLQRKRRPLTTGSSGSTGATWSTDAGVSAPAKVQDDLTFEFLAPNQVQYEDDNPLHQTDCLRVLISNALLAVDFFLKEHGIATSRTPEIQFLGHACNAIVNMNTFRIAPGYVPKATFDGLVIDSTLDGALLFGDGLNEGFMEFGDAIALLQALAHHLRGVPHFVSGGDAG